MAWDGAETLAGVDWGFMYQLLPSLMSLGIILGSTVPGSALRKNVSNIPDVDEDDKTFATNVALDWAIRLGFHTAMASALVSVAVMFSDLPNFALLVGTLCVLAFIWWVMVHYLWKEEIGEMVEGGVLGPAFWCNAVLLYLTVI